MDLSTYLEYATQCKQSEHRESDNALYYLTTTTIVLSLHETIEDREVFQKLAARVPYFSKNSLAEGKCSKDHRDINEGMNYSYHDI